MDLAQTIMMSSSTGTFYGVSVGVALHQMTHAACQLLARCPVIAYAATDHGDSRALQLARPFVPHDAELHPCALPLHQKKERRAARYRHHGENLARFLQQGRDVAYLCLGDPLLYGSYWHLRAHLSDYPCRVMSGVSAMSHAAALANQAIVMGDDLLTIAPFGRLNHVLARLSDGEGVVLLKVTWQKELWQSLINHCTRHHLLQHSFLAQDRDGEMVIFPLSQWRDMGDDGYFSLVLIPARGAIHHD